MTAATYAGRLLQRAILSVSLAASVLLLSLGGLGFLMAALFLWLEIRLGAPGAAAITGGTLILLALLTLAAGALILGRLRRRTPHLLTAAAESLASMTSLAGLLVRADPKRALLFALLAGAVTEYFATPDKPRG